MIICHTLLNTKHSLSGIIIFLGAIILLLLSRADSEVKSVELPRKFHEGDVVFLIKYRML